MTTSAYDVSEGEWPTGSGGPGRPGNPEHDALAKRLADGETLRIDAPTGTAIETVQKQIKYAMTRRGVKTNTRIHEGALYIRQAIVVEP